MKLWTIKRKGKDWIGNYLWSYEIPMKKTKIIAQFLFYRKKDAKLYIEEKYTANQESFEVIKLEMI